MRLRSATRRNRPPGPPSQSMWSKPMRASSANAMVSSDSWTPETRKRKASKPMNAPTRGAEDDREPDARPGPDAEVKEEPRRRVRAQADVQRMAERELAGEPHHHVPGLADVREVEGQRRDREDVAVGDERERERQQTRPRARDQRRARAAVGRRAAVSGCRIAHLRAAPMRPCGRASRRRTRSPKLDHALRRRRDEHARERLRHPDHHAAEQRADHRAEAAHDDDDEREQRVARAEPGRHVDERHHRAAGHRDGRGAEPERDGVEVRDGQAGDARADRIVGAGADRLAGEGQAKERRQQRRRDHRGAGRVDPRPCRAASARARTNRAGSSVWTLRASGPKPSSSALPRIIASAIISSIWECSGRRMNRLMKPRCSA